MGKYLIPKTIAAKTVASAGTAEAIVASPVRAASILIQADVDNTGNMYLGDSTVDDSNGIEVAPGQVIEWTGDQARGIEQQIDMSQIYVDADNDGEGIRILVLVPSSAGI